MTTRRDFLKCSTLLGTTAYFSTEYALAQTTPSQATSTATGGPDPLFAAAHGAIRATSSKPRVIIIPDVGNYKVLKGDFHIHTLFSDGDVMPKARVQEAIQNGFDAISITDHIEHRPFLSRGVLRLAENNDDHDAAYKMAKPEADKSNLILIKGTEITKRTMPPGHFNALFIKDANAIAAVVDDWKKMLEVATEQGGFITWNHPGWVAPTSGGLAKDVPMAFTAEHEDVRKKGHLHAIEVFNDTEHYPIVSDWCNELDLGMLAVSDIHPTELQQYGLQNPRRPMTLILAEERTEASIREAFFAKRTLGWVADMIFGRPEWVQKLFAACVEIAPVHTINNVEVITLKNKSDIPIVLKVAEQHFSLPPQGELGFSPGSNRTWQVTNWFVGTYKPLTATLANGAWIFD